MVILGEKALGCLLKGTKASYYSPSKRLLIILLQPFSKIRFITRETQTPAPVRQSLGENAASMTASRQ